MKTKRVGECLLAEIGECLLAETDRNGSPGPVQGARGELPALRNLRPVKPVGPDAAGFASGVLGLGFRLMFAWAVQDARPFSGHQTRSVGQYPWGSVAQD